MALSLAAACSPGAFVFIPFLSLPFPSLQSKSHPSNLSSDLMLKAIRHRMLTSHARPTYTLNIWLHFLTCSILQSLPQPAESRAPSSVMFCKRKSQWIDFRTRYYNFCSRNIIKRYQYSMNFVWKRYRINIVSITHFCTR